LNIKYSKHKQEIKDDPLMDFLLSTKEFFKKNSNNLSIGLIAVVVIFIGFSIYNFSTKSGEKKLQESFGAAMISYNNQQMDKATENLKIVADKHPKAAQGIQSAFLLAGMFFEQGKYDDAKKYYEIASGEKNEFIGAQSIEGIAACYEAKGDIPSSLKYLQMALNDKRISYRHGAIRWKMALLNKSSDVAKTKVLCNEIIADTSATEYHQPAENLLAVVDIAG
jgi:predicted negative regulator of RcsB-dependent stress response